MEIVTVTVRITTPEDIARWNRAREALKIGSPGRPEYQKNAPLARNLIQRGIDEVLRGQEATNDHR